MGGVAKLGRGSAAERPEKAGATALVREAARGDEAAAAQLLRLLAPEMLRVVRGVMGPYHADAEDALQQSLIGLVHALPAFRGDCSPAGYACRIAFRTALRLRRGLSAQRGREGELEADAESEDQAPPSAVDARRRTEALRRLLGEIPAEQAEALALRTMLGWSLEEIAAAMGVPLNTVRSRLRLAKEALRARIEGDPVVAEELGVP